MGARRAGARCSAARKIDLMADQPQELAATGARAATQLPRVEEVVRARRADLRAALAGRLECVRRRRERWHYAIPEGYSPSRSLRDARAELRSLGRIWVQNVLSRTVPEQENQEKCRENYKACELVIHWFLKRAGFENSALARYVVMHVDAACAAIENCVPMAPDFTSDPSITASVSKILETYASEAVEAQLQLEIDGIQRREAYWEAFRQRKAELAASKAAAEEAGERPVVEEAGVAGAADAANPADATALPPPEGDHYPYWIDLGPEDNEDIVPISSLREMTGAHPIMRDQTSPEAMRAIYVCYAMGASPFERPYDIHDDLVPKPRWSQIYRQENSSLLSHNVFADGFSKLDKVEQTFCIGLTPFGATYSHAQKYNYEHFKTMCYLQNFPIPTQRRIALILEDIAIGAIMENEAFVHLISNPCTVHLTMSPTEYGPDGTSPTKFTMTVVANQPAESLAPVWVSGCVVPGYNPTSFYQPKAYGEIPAMARSRIPQWFKYYKRAGTKPPAGSVPDDPITKQLPLLVYTDPVKNCLIGSNLGPIVRVTYAVSDPDSKASGAAGDAAKKTARPRINVYEDGLPDYLQSVEVHVDTSRPGMINGSLAFFLAYMWYFCPTIRIRQHPLLITPSEGVNYYTDYYVFNDAFHFAKIWGLWDASGRDYICYGKGVPLDAFEDFEAYQRITPFERLFCFIVKTYCWKEKPYPEFLYPHYPTVFWEETNLSLAHAHPTNWSTITKLDELNLWGKDITFSSADGFRRSQTTLKFEHNRQIEPLSNPVNPAYPDGPRSSLAAAQDEGEKEKKEEAS